MKDSHTSQATGAWNVFTVGSFLIASGMMAGGIYFLDASFAAKGYYAMAAIMLVHTTATITKTMRDIEDAKLVRNRSEAERTEKLLDGLTHHSN